MHKDLKEIKAELEQILAALDCLTVYRRVFEDGALIQLKELLKRTLDEGRAQKFILFIDDLSFEENETEFKDLKALLEGSIAKPPANVLVYATSNRRNLVAEFFSDRSADEVGKQDTYQEKLSLADRFGIKLVYSTPGQQAYLDTVKDMAEKNGIDLDEVKLCDLALKWALVAKFPLGKDRQAVH